MSVNDVLCSGAEPLFFLDYIATGKIESAVLKDVVRGIVEGCRQANCALVGGETAEMPGMYKAGDYDLAGFCVGIADKSKILGGHRAAVGDAVVGLESSGLHSNGFSLVRKVFSPLELKARAQEFLKPTRIYVKPVLSVLKKFNASGFNIKSLAHITGGAFYDKARRAVSPKTTMVVYKNAWQPPAIFEELKAGGNIEEKEMFRTFNMGIGMVVVVRDAVKMDIVRAFSSHGVKAFLIGEIVSGVGGVAVA
jgi:phosphoribosylformylglycinamidine cyclo-ligase